MECMDFMMADESLYDISTEGQRQPITETAIMKDTNVSRTSCTAGTGTSMKCRICLLRRVDWDYTRIPLGGQDTESRDF